MSLKKWRALVKAVELGSFSKAAEELGYTQSGISHMISNLEEEYAIPLLNRSSAGVSLSKEGELLIPEIEALLNAEDRLKTRLENIHTEMTDRLILGTYASISKHWIPLILDKMREEFPKTEIEIHIGSYHELVTWLDSNKIDLMLGEQYVRPGIVWEVIAEDAYIALCPENSKAAQDEVFNASSLHGSTLFYECDCLEADQIDNVYNRGSRMLTVRSEDDSVILSLVKKGIGCCILPNLCTIGQTEGLVYKPLQFPIHRNLGLAMKRSYTPSPAENKMLELLKETAPVLSSLR